MCKLDFQLILTVLDYHIVYIIILDKLIFSEIRKKYLPERANEIFIDLTLKSKFVSKRESLPSLLRS